VTELQRRARDLHWQQFINQNRPSIEYTTILLTALAAEVHLAKGQLQLFKSTSNDLKSPKFNNNNNNLDLSFLNIAS
jgi:hypothetical protein